MKTLLTIIALFCLTTASGQVDTLKLKPCTDCFQKQYVLENGEPKPKLNLDMAKAKKGLSTEGKILIGGLSAIVLGAIYGRIYGTTNEIINTTR